MLPQLLDETKKQFHTEKRGGSLKNLITIFWLCCFWWIREKAIGFGVMVGGCIVKGLRTWQHSGSLLSEMAVDCNVWGRQIRDGDSPSDHKNQNFLGSSLSPEQWGQLFGISILSVCSHQKTICHVKLIASLLFYINVSTKDSGF